MDKITILKNILYKFGYWELDDFCAQMYADRNRVCFRSYGNWITPVEAYVEDDYEDYDWKELSPSTAKKVDQKCKELEQTYGIKLRWSPEEKEWIDVQVVDWGKNK